MKEGNFETTKEEVERRKDRETKKVKPITLKEHEKIEKIEEKPMVLKDHWLSLRNSIEDMLNDNMSKGEECEQEQVKVREQVKLMSELISPELMVEYKNIIKSFNEKTRKNEGHLQREFINIESEEVSNEIEKWIENLVKEVKIKKGNDFNESDLEEIKAQSWLLFNSFTNVLNTKSLEDDINDFYKGKTFEIEQEKEQEKQKVILMKELQSRYPFDKNEIEILVDIVRFKKNGQENYSFEILSDTIINLWKEYNLGGKKGKIAAISFGYLGAELLSSFGPSLFQNLIKDNKFDVAVFLEVLGLNKVTRVIEAKTNIELAKMMNEVNHQINERITNSLFFQEFEFIHDKSLGEIYDTLSKGKVATKEIIQDTISKLVPISSGILMSLGFLANINPILGSIGVASLPVMFAVAKKQNKKIWPMYEKEKREGEKISTELGSIKDGIEEIKTSPETHTVASHLKNKMDIKDTLSLDRFKEETIMDLKRMIPMDVAGVAAVVVGGALQEAGDISGGTILSNVQYTNQLNRSVGELVDLYFNKFSRYIQDINRMNEILGEYDKLDLPEGEKENNRIPISKLENFDISIKDLKFKDILRGINLDIKQGEFLAIAGASGAGKSTLLRNLVGLYKPDSGEVKIGGKKNDTLKKYGKESLYSVMSYCNQNPQIFEGKTLRENLLLWSKEEMGDEKIKKVLEDLHLNKLINKLDEEPKNLSGGEKVRIGLARTLIKGSKIMLLDEPTASLDSQSETEVRKIIKEISKKYSDVTIICVSHDIALLNESDRIVNMKDLQK